MKRCDTLYRSLFLVHKDLAAVSEALVILHDSRCFTQDGVGAVIRYPKPVAAAHVIKVLSGAGIKSEAVFQEVMRSSETFSKLLKTDQLDPVSPKVLGDINKEVSDIINEFTSLKLTFIVREEAMRFLSGFADPKTAEDLHRFSHLITNPNCIKIIWSDIEKRVAKRMFDTFGCLYDDKTDSRFIDLMNSGKSVTLKDLSCFQKQIQSSPGYHKHCSELVRGGLFSEKKDLKDLIDRRHDNAEAQHNYDKRYGLTKKPIN